MSAFAPKAPQNEMDAGVAFIVKKLKTTMASRGASGILGLGRRFKIMDDDNSKSLDLSEYKKAMKEMQLNLNDQELRLLFDHFDADKGGTIDYEEFIQGVRDPLTPRRLDLVHKAFGKIDLDGSGEVTPNEVVKLYNADKHPDVISGKKTRDQVLREFLDTFDVGGVKDGIVTRKEFENYYTNIGANIDNEDYFELMIRNAWHISGGEGSAANSANKRVLATMADGSQQVVEIEDDLGLDSTDKEEMMRRLRSQGLNVTALNTNGSTDEASPPEGGVTAGQRSGGSGSSGKKHTGGAANPTFSSSIQLGGVGQAKGLATVGKPQAFRAKRGAVAADHVDIHSSDLKATLGFAARNGNDGSNGAAPVKAKSLADHAGLSSVTATVDRLKAQLASRGAKGIIGLGRKFRIMDDDSSGSLNISEFKKAMNECALSLSEQEIAALFKYFDLDKSGSIDFEEFLGGVRGAMNPRRLGFVSQAFDILDKDGNGFVEPSDIVSAYDAKKHPDVISGKKTSDEVLREFLDTFDVGGEKDGKVTRNEFENYYKNVSASVDNDDYFELMMRNAWHISGGEGWCANSANRRVLVTDKSGNQSVVEIKDDLGIKADDKDEMMRRLRAQGTDAASIDTKGGTDDNANGGANKKRENPNFKKTSLW